MSPFLDAADDQALLREVVAFYARTLRESPEPVGWLSKRGIALPEAVDRFQLGYANRSLGLALPPGGTKAGAEIRARLQKIGILRESGHEHLAGALVIPVFDEAGAVVQLYGRLIGASLRAGTRRDVYLPGPLRGVWNAGGVTGKEVILAGSLLDGLAVWSAGLTNVTAAATLEEVPEDVLAAVKVREIETVLVAYPLDDEGNKAATRVAEALTGQGILAVRVELPQGMGAGELLRRRGPGALVEAVERARPKSVSALPIPEATPPVEVTVVLTKPTPEPAPAPPEPALAMIPAERQRPPATEPEVAPDDTAHEVVIEIEDRRYRVRGMEKNGAYSALKVNLLATREGRSEGAGAAFHIDTLDLYVARQRAAFVRQAAIELGLKEDVVKRDVGQVLLRLEALQDETIRMALQPKTKAVTLTEAEEGAAKALLTDPKLLDRIARDFSLCGVVGEETNALVGYLAAVSRKLDQPLAVVVQSSSAAGKTSLLDAILAFVPPEDRLKYSALTGQVLYYLGASEIAHKILAVAEEEGAERASYALKLLQSERELRIASTGKDSNGRLVAQEYTVAGPVAIFFTTTAVQVDEELLNRCIVLSVDEGREQTKAIHRLQRERETLDGLVANREREAILKLHQDAQRLLRPLLVTNPYAPSLTFQDDRTRTRRDHLKYLGLIKAVALLHQLQREVKRTSVGGMEIEYIEATPADIALANRLADEVLGRSLDDLPPHTRRLLGLLHELVTASCAAEGIEQAAYRFTRKTVRESTGWGDTQLKLHLHRLVELEHLLVHRGSRGSHVYELAYDGRGRDGERFLAGLLDPEKLQRAGSGRPPVGPWSGVGRTSVVGGES